MITLLLIIFLALMFIAIANDKIEIAVVPGIMLIVLLIVDLAVGACLLEIRVIPEKIELYEAQNAEIEAEISALVEQYMQYESDTYGELKGESAVSLVSLYPELKADTLVTRQCELYISNNEAIRDMKEELINASTYRWLLYFGK